MKIAIMGAGLSGLACAITLEKHGINPTIFEKRSQVGDRFVYGEILLSIVSKPIDDAIRFLAEEHQIYLQPISNISTLLVYSENESTAITGHLGFTNLRGRDADSFENQLVRQVKTKIHYNSKLSYEHLLQDYTHVIVATGDGNYAKTMQEYKVGLSVTLRGATVAGDFDPHTVAAWLDYKLAPLGYGYFIPLSSKEANIVLAYPEYPETLLYDQDTLWDKFQHRVSQDLNQTLRITDQFDINNYLIGSSTYPRIGNTFFTGNCLGAIMPFLGFGQVAALLSGIYAAQDLVGLGDYDKLTKHIRQSYADSLVLRRQLERLDNHQLDTVVKALNGGLAKRIINTKRANPLRLASYLLRPLLAIHR